MDLTALVALISELGAVLGVIIPVVIRTQKIAEGQKCQLRSEMLRIYYHNREKEALRQYEYENFALLYKAYKALGGNSFIDKIQDEIKKWDIVP